MEKYLHKVNYYETDKMGITHHSNYIRWMEEARINFLDQVGFGYDKLEANGVFSPVLSVECDYKKSTTFGDTVAIEVTVEEYKGARFSICYTMQNVKTGDIVLVGKTGHCFVNGQGRPVLLRKVLPEFDGILKSLMQPSL